MQGLSSGSSPLVDVKINLLLLFDVVESFRLEDSLGLMKSIFDIMLASRSAAGYASRGEVFFWIVMICAACVMCGCDGGGDRKPEPPPISQESVKALEDKILQSEGGDSARVSEMLSRTNAEAAEVQERLGDSFELDNYELAEVFWKAARDHGRTEAGPKHWFLTRWILRHPVLSCIIAGALLLVFAVFGVHRQDKAKAEQQRIEQKRREEERRKAVLQTPWWNIPEGSSLYFDTSILMTQDQCVNKMMPKVMYPDDVSLVESDGIAGAGLDVWFKWMLGQAETRKWKLYVLREVFAEISRHKRSGTQKQKYGARVALRRIEEMQKVAESRVDISTCEADSSYADPVLLKRVVADPKGVLLTNDRALAICVRNEFIKRGLTSTDSSRLLVLDEFVPLP